jgi:hypothetical protein
MKLTIELVPKPCWNRSLAHLHSLNVFPLWDNIRHEAIVMANGKCDICGCTPGLPGSSLHCHEIWQYDDVDNVQTLKDVISICHMCHHVKHLGLAEVLASQGKLDFQKVIDHFLEVNGCKLPEFQRHAREAFQIWNERSEKEWTTNFGPYHALVNTDDMKLLNGPPPDEAVALPGDENEDIPSSITSKIWVNVYNRKQFRPKSNGKWLIKGTAQEMDDLWPLVKEATVQGSLGISAFASTSAFKGKQRIIGVCTGEKQDIQEVAALIAGLGVKGTIEWKDDKTKKVEMTCDIGENT